MHLFRRFDVGCWICRQFLLATGCLVRRPEQAFLQSAELDFWTGVDNVVCVDRIGRRSRLEQKFTFHCDETVVDADGAQRHLESDILRIANAYRSAGYHRPVAAGDLGIYEVKFRANAGRDLFVRSLLRLGGIRYDPECFDRLA